MFDPVNINLFESHGSDLYRLYFEALAVFALFDKQVDKINLKDYLYNM